MHTIFTCIGIPRNTWRLSWFRYKTFITFLTFRFSTRGERDTILTMLTVRPASALNSLTQPTRVHPAANNWTRLGPNLNLLLFFKIPKNPSPSFPGMTSFTSPVPFLIRDIYCDICDGHILPALAGTPPLNVCLYPCFKPNSSKPN